MLVAESKRFIIGDQERMLYDDVTSSYLPQVGIARFSLNRLRCINNMPPRPQVAD